MIAAWRGRKDGGGTPSHAGSDSPPVAADAPEFLDKTLWALEALHRHAGQRGHAALAAALLSACQAARAELTALQPPPARVASERIRALWQHEGRR